MFELDTLVASISAIVAAIGLGYSAITYRQEAGSRYAELLKNYADDIETLESSQVVNNDHRIFAQRYLNVHERLAYLALRKLIPRNIAIFFNKNFAKAEGLLLMPEYAQYDNDEFTENIRSWCRKIGIKPDSPPLPYPRIEISPHYIDLNPVQHYVEDLFMPQDMVVRVGDFVAWTNKDTQSHRIISGTGPNDPNSGKEFDCGDDEPLGLTKIGKSFAHEFTSRGDFPYYCKHHPASRGLIQVH